MPVISASRSLSSSKRRRIRSQAGHLRALHQVRAHHQRRPARTLPGQRHRARSQAHTHRPTNRVHQPGKALPASRASIPVRPPPPRRPPSPATRTSNLHDGEVIPARMRGLRSSVTHTRMPTKAPSSLSLLLHCGLAPVSRSATTFAQSSPGVAAKRHRHACDTMLVCTSPRQLDLMAAEKRQQSTWTAITIFSSDFLTAASSGGISSTAWNQRAQSFDLLGRRSENEFIAIHMPTKEIAARINAPNEC